MKNAFKLLLIAAVGLSPAVAWAAGGNAALADHRWIHGSEDCSSNTDPAIETFKFDENTFVLRQNKCVNYEAPFIYVLFGTHTALVLDTGATSDAEQFPLYDTVRALVDRRQADRSQPISILVLHSHSHADHTEADGQFKGMPGVTVVEPGRGGVETFLAETRVDGSESTVDLGERTLTLFPIPGHQAESIALYDPRTQWLLTGDTVYPGMISVLDWAAYHDSITTLSQFSAIHEVSGLLGSHIEMSQTASVVYERGTTYQPAEASLILPVSVLSDISAGLAQLNGKRGEVVTDAVVVRSVPFLARVIIRVLKAFGAG